MKGELDTVL